MLDEKQRALISGVQRKPKADQNSCGFQRVSSRVFDIKGSSDAKVVNLLINYDQIGGVLAAIR